MTNPLVAIAIDDDGQVSQHAGRASFWKVYTWTGEDGALEEVWTLSLTEAGCLHEWHVRGDGNRHPLHAVDVAIAGSGGEGVIRRLAERKTRLLATPVTDPDEALKRYRQGDLPDGAPHDEGSCGNEGPH